LGKVADPNRSTTGWAKRGALPFKVVDLMQAPMQSQNYEQLPKESF